MPQDAEFQSCQQRAIHLSIKRSLRLAMLLALASCLWLSTPVSAEDPLRQDALKQFGILEAVREEKLSEPAVLLGQSLFWDQRLSGNGKIACASCHRVEDWGADHKRFSVDARGKDTSRNSQTIFNAVLQPTLRWTGDRKSGAHQAERSLTGSMGFSAAEDVVPLLKKHGYTDGFLRAFPQESDPVSPANYALAVQAYEATLLTPAPIDLYLAGADDALDVKQKDGLKLFLSMGCAGCHKGKLLGGGSFEKFGVVKDYWLATKSENKDVGRFETTKDEADRYKFRVSMLRNIGKTAPYFHDGSVKTLDEAVRIMSSVQLGADLNDDDAAAIVAFLNALTGDVPKNYKKP
ncbi:c-type cytochrome [bacterium]|nr:c-type cytochrome [bacterium]